MTKRCIGVAYLESEYPREMCAQLISREFEFNKGVSSRLTWRSARVTECQERISPTRIEQNPLAFCTGMICCKGFEDKTGDKHRQVIVVR